MDDYFYRKNFYTPTEYEDDVAVTITKNHVDILIKQIVHHVNPVLVSKTPKVRL